MDRNDLQAELAFKHALLNGETSEIVMGRAKVYAEFGWPASEGTVYAAQRLKRIEEGAGR